MHGTRSMSILSRMHLQLLRIMTMTPLSWPDIGNTKNQSTTSAKEWHKTQDLDLTHGA